MFLEKKKKKKKKINSGMLFYIVCGVLSHSALPFQAIIDTLISLKL